MIWAGRRMTPESRQRVRLRRGGHGQNTTRPIRAAGAGPATPHTPTGSVRRRSCPPNCPPESLLTCPGTGHGASQACTMAPFLQLTNLCLVPAAGIHLKEITGSLSKNPPDLQSPLTESNRRPSPYHRQPALPCNCGRRFEQAIRWLTRAAASRDEQSLAGFCPQIPPGESAGTQPRRLPNRRLDDCRIGPSGMDPCSEPKECLRLVSGRRSGGEEVEP